MKLKVHRRCEEFAGHVEAQVSRQPSARLRIGDSDHKCDRARGVEGVEKFRAVGQQVGQNGLLSVYDWAERLSD
jgi:hypothetical protein